jgi:predicted RNA-binding protein with PIN domain
MSAHPPAVLLVDGYNIIGTIPHFKRLRDRQGLEASRHALAEVLTGYSAYHDHETELVFDAQYQQGSGGKRQQLTGHLAIYYTDWGQTADSYIERYCALFFREDVRRFQKRLIVATSDRAQWITAVGYGAEWMSARQLAHDLGMTQQNIHRHQKKSATKRFLGQNLDATAQEKLTHLRQQLLQRGN